MSERSLSHCLSVVLENVNTLLAKEDYGRLFAVVHFASRQWKVTNEDLILIENHIDAECGDRIRLEKVCVLYILSVITIWKGHIFHTCQIFLALSQLFLCSYQLHCCHCQPKHL